MNLNPVTINNYGPYCRWTIEHATALLEVGKANNKLRDSFHHQWVCTLIHWGSKLDEGLMDITSYIEVAEACIMEVLDLIGADLSNQVLDQTTSNNA